MCPQVLLRSSEFWIGFHTTLGEIDTFVFFLFGHSQAHHGFDNAEGDAAGDEDPEEDGKSTDDLTAEAGTVIGNGNQQES